jgi:putative lipoprotein
MRSKGFLFLVGLALASGAAGQQGGDPTSGWLPDPRPLARTLVYQCPGPGGEVHEFVARLGPGEMALWLADRYLVLSRVHSASGVKYQEGDVMFWMKGEGAMLDAGAERYRDCRRVPAREPWEDARRRGVSFRATGHGPGWFLELSREGGLLYVGDDGATRLQSSAVDRETAKGVITLQGSADGHQLRVEVVEGVCTDSMQGATFPRHVTVQVDGERYRGCGMDLPPWRSPIEKKSEQ